MPPRGPKKNFYAVRNGRVPGIYTTWAQCEAQTKKYPGAQFRGFVTLAEAASYLDGGAARNNVDYADEADDYDSVTSFAPVKQEAHHSAAAAAGASPTPASPASFIPLPSTPSIFSPPSASLQYAPSAPQQERVNPHLTRIYQSVQQSLNYVEQYKRTHPYERVDTRPSPNKPPRRDALLVAAQIAAQRAALAVSDHAASAATAAPSRPRARAFSSSAAADRPASASSPPSAFPVGALSAFAPARYGVVYCDGAAKANPVGPIGCGCVLYAASADAPSQAGACLEQSKRFLGHRGSNNESEYHGILTGMELAQQHGITHLTIKLDSELVAKQMTGEYKVKAANLNALYQRALTLASQFRSCDIQHVYREQNTVADRLANEAITEGLANDRGY